MTTLLITVVVAGIFLYSAKDSIFFDTYLKSSGWLGIFIGGCLYAYGFTAAPATALLLLLAKDFEPIFAGLVAGIGALISDILIFVFVRFSFGDEVERIKEEKPVLWMRIVGRQVFGTYYRYVVPLLACVVIASPLPTEVGVAMLASLKRMTMKKFILLAYILHSVGIIVVLFIGKSI